MARVPRLLQQMMMKMPIDEPSLDPDGDDHGDCVDTERWVGKVGR